MPQPARRCANCAEPQIAQFCAHCGEKRLAPADHTLRRFFEHLFEAFTHADGKIFLSVRCLLTRPGRLTADYLHGKRKPYIPPLQLFLIANLIFFLLHPLIGSNTLTTDLNTQLHYTWHHTIAEAWVAPRLVARSVTAEVYAVTFNPAATTLAKSLVILVVPLFSLAVLALHWRQRRHYSAHLVFSLHFGAFWMLLICATLALTNLVVRLLRSVDVFPSASAVSDSVIGVSLVLMTLYLFRASRLVYTAEPAWQTAARALAMAIIFTLSLQVYRFALFFITFWST
ncbi:MAG: DUF3667 domain-containing protein [Candidatus Didemnitutus sp.]|nr:DUF3667 domain-containing protein [Candidatus Didemnitutus sp.]